MKIKNGRIISENTGVSILASACPDIRLVYILNGKIIQGERELFSGDCFFVDKNETLDYEADGEACLAWFSFDGEDNSFTLGRPLACADTEKAEQLINLLCPQGTWQSVNDAFDKSAANMLISLLAYGNETVGSVGNKYVDMAKRYIDINYSKQIKVEDIADNIGVDRKYLRNLFFKYLGVSTKDYLTDVRIEKAKEMLAQSSVAVGEIALAVGYSDALAFSKLFKKHVGVSPSEYRNGVVDDAAEEDVKVYTPKKEDIKYFLL